MTEYLIVGNGVAANSAAETIRRLDQEGSIRMFTREEFPFYYTPALPEYLSGDKALRKIFIHDLPWYEKNRMTLHRGTEVLGIDLSGKTVIMKDGRRFHYDRLLLATGAACQVPSISGTNTDGVFTLRTIADADAIIERAKKAKKVVLIGGGRSGTGSGKRAQEKRSAGLRGRIFPPAASQTNGHDRGRHSSEANGSHGVLFSSGCRNP